MLKTICERQERELKQRDSSSKSDGVRLTRQEEQINKQRIEQHKLGEGNAVMSYLINSLIFFIASNGVSHLIMKVGLVENSD